MRKPRLSKNTIEKLFHEGRARSGKYEYEITQDWDGKINAYVDKLTRWDKDDNYDEWEITAKGIWEFEEE